MISVVIPTHNPVHIEKTLQALQNQTFKDFEVIVCENPEITSRTQQIVSGYNVKHVNSAIGANNARNTGVHFAQYDIIALTDDDCVPSQNWLETIYSTFQDKEVSCVGGRVELEFTEPVRSISKLQAGYLAEINWGRTEKPRYLLPGEYLVSANLAFTREAFNNVGGFNSNLGYIGKDHFIPNDEVLFIRDCGSYGKVFYDHDMVIRHITESSRVSMEYLIKRAYGQGYANVLMSKEQGNKGYSSHEVFYDTTTGNDNILQIAKVTGITHALKGIKPCKRFYSLLAELVPN